MLTETAEFRRHRDVTNPAYIVGFLSQWKVYLEELEDKGSEGFKGRRLDPELFQKVRSEGHAAVTMYANGPSVDVLRADISTPRADASYQGRLAPRRLPGRAKVWWLAVSISGLKRV